MSGFRPFTRQLGSQPGVQLNPLMDDTDGASQSNSDQILATVARLTRGRIDRVFRVNRNNLEMLTGIAQAVRANALNEAKLQVYEALNNGAAEAVLMRMTASDAVKSFAVVQWGQGVILTPTVVGGVITAVAVTAGGTGYVTGASIVVSGTIGSGAIGTITAAAGVITAVTLTAGGTAYTTPTVTVAVVPVYTVSASVPTANTFRFHVMHNHCFNDGIKISFHANATPVVGTAVSNKLITVRFSDSLGNVMDSFDGSLDSTAKDDYNQSLFLPDVIASRVGDGYVMVVATGATVDPGSNAYGRDSSGVDVYSTSATLVCFTEGTLTYTTTDYDRFVAGLRDTIHPFGYLISGGTQAVSLLGKLSAFAIDANTCIGVDLDGNLSTAAAGTLMSSLNFDSHYIHVYWAPLEADDPLVGGKTVWGTAGLNIGLRCARNARVNDKGFAPKNFPVAGKDWPVNRTGIRQLVRPLESELSDLAALKINPVVYETYTGGGKFVYTDSLTAAKTVVSYKKLISVAEMSSSVDLAISLYSKELLQLPMSEFIKRMNAFLSRLFPDAVASKWLVPSKNLPGNAPFSYTVGRSSARPADLALVNYWTCYDGVARQVILQQTLVT
ncbi:MAG: hypothetical protein H7293_20050 [Candidatus Saccharibacteria bacterium]|nr:hypothetical protein [Rhodoferax sp.]